MTDAVGTGCEPRQSPGQYTDLQRKARTGTEPSRLNRWPRAHNLSCQRLKPEAERKHKRLVQASTTGQAGALG